MNRIWKMIRKRKPPLPPQFTKGMTQHTTSMTLAMSLQSIVAKRFVICEEWMNENAPGAPANPHPWAIIGVYRTSPYHSEVMLLMAPFKENGFTDFNNTLHVPAGKVGVAADQIL